MDSIKVFAPGTVANVACGFDVIGLALDAPGDEMILRRSGKPGIRITAIHGAELPLPLRPWLWGFFNAAF